MTLEYRGYRIEGDGTFGMKVIKTIGQGKLPDCLIGSFSRNKEAQFAIDQYRTYKDEIDNRPPAVKKITLTPRE